MEAISNALRIIADHADKIDANNEKLIEELHQRLIRPLQEATIMKNIEVAKRLNISPAMVTQLVASKKIHTTEDGRISEYHLWKYITRDGSIK